MRLRMMLAILCASAVAMPARADQPLSLRRVMLSQGGVGYFQYDANVEGAATLGLDVPRAAVSDVLTSFVVLDGAGTVESVVLPSAEPLAGVLSGLPIPRDALSRPVDLLNALQGVTVTVAGAVPLTGRILHAEPPPEVATVANGVIDPRVGKTRVTLLSIVGLQQFLLEDVAAVQVADPVLRGKMLAALNAMRGSAASEQRHLSVRVGGTGSRIVRLGMVIAAPLWKASYRLVMPAADVAGPPIKVRLQAWAVLENAGLDDWSDVELTLQSGNPVAFQQAIYKTYYVHRPEVPLDVLRRLAPPADTQAGPPVADQQSVPAPMMRSMAPLAAAAAAPAPMAAPGATAEASSNGVETSFTLPQRLSLAAGQSASVPFLDRSVAASRVDLLASGAAHPLAAVRLVNDTGTGLPPGLVTTYDQGGFTGDARIGPLPDGESRLLSFAEDLATSAVWQTRAATSVLGVAAANGVLRVTRRERTTTMVELQAPKGAPRRVLVEIPRHGGATLSTEPSVPIERTATAWRLDVSLAAGEQRSIAAFADHVVASSTVLDSDAGQIVAVLGEQGLPQAERAALQHVADLSREAAARDAEREKLATQQASIEQDETRLRANLAAVPATDPLHGQLMRALAADEDSLAILATRQREAAEAASRAHQALADAISTLSL